MGDSSRWSRRRPRTIDAEQAARVAEKYAEGRVHLATARSAVGQIQNIGGIGGLMGAYAGIAK